MPVRLTLALLAVALAAPATLAVDDAPDRKPANFKTVAPEEFERLAKEPGTVLLDVRTPREHAESHLKDAKLIDLRAPDFDKQIAALDKDKTYLVYCAVGLRGARACEKLDKLAFPKVYNLEGGIKAWQKAGKPTEK